MTITLWSLLIAASAGILGLLGTLHLLFTFYGERLHPREAQLKLQMEASSPVLTRQTTMWRAWIGFNASHSYGAMLFGVVWGYLALRQAPFLSDSWFMLLLGLAVLAAYLVLARLYWFSVPFRGILLATVLYAAGLSVKQFAQA
jgi:hypothetical protein